MNHHTRRIRWRAVLSRPGRERQRWVVPVLAMLASVALAAAGCGLAVGLAKAPAVTGHTAGDSFARQELAGPGSPARRPAGKQASTHSTHKRRSARRTASSGQASHTSGGTPSGTVGSTLFGGTLELTHEAARLGRRLAIVRIYDHIGEKFPVAPDPQVMAAGSTLLVSLDSDGPSYAAIAAGREDAKIVPWLRAVNRAAVQYHLSAIYVSFEHEPDNPQHHNLGTPAQFVAAWDHVHRLAASGHLDWNNGGRLHWVWILIHSTFSNGRAGLFWPGPGEVDIVAADGYNSYGCQVAAAGGHPSAKASGAVTPGTIFNSLLGFAASHGGLPVFLSEWGSDPIPDGTQASFIRQMQSYLAAHPVIAAALYWDEDGSNCKYSVDGNPASLTALSTLGRLGIMQGSMAEG